MTGHQVRWGIIGAGGIARDFRDGALGSATGRIVAIGTRRPDDPDIARDFPGISIRPGYEALLEDPDVDAVYVATPHVLHARWAIAAANLGKHVLCEKPMGMSGAETGRMFAAARNADTFMAEAMMYRLAPLIERIIDLVRQCAVGEVRMIRSSFGFAFPRPPEGHRLFARQLGGGAILDLGGYPASICRLIAGCGSSDGPAEPVSVIATGHVGSSGADEYSAATLTFANGVIAQLAVSISVSQDNVLQVCGTHGRLEVNDFWFAGGKSGGTNVMRLFGIDGNCRDLAVESNRNLYSYQFESANRAIIAGAKELSWPGMTAEDSVGNASVLDQWLAGAGMHYT